MYMRVPPALDSVGVDSKEQLCKFVLYISEVVLVILVSLTAAISKTLFVDFTGVQNHQNFYLMSMHLCEIGIVNYFFQEILKFEIVIRVHNIFRLIFCSGENLLK